MLLIHGSFHGSQDMVDERWTLLAGLFTGFLTQNTNATCSRDGVRGDHVLLAPAYTVTVEELQTITNILAQAYIAVAATTTGKL